jgi:Interferon-induced transmembrane protein/Protein of unknown function (DUF2510)
MADIPAGWYPNPEDASTQRYWDGDAWTDSTAPAPPSLATPPPGTAGGTAGWSSAQPDNNLVWAILATVLCCMPFGVVAIVYAARVDSLWMTGDRAGAIAAAESSKKWTKWSVAGFALSLVVPIVLIALITLLGEPADQNFGGVGTSLQSS